MSSNKLELGQFIHWDQGENYPFNACMAKLMSCLGGDPELYTYEFFAGLSGDDFVMCYGNNEAYNDCVSVCTDAEMLFERLNKLIGLEYCIVKKEEWSANYDQYYSLIKEYIDKGIPILTKGTDNYRNYDLLISYDDETGKGHLSCGDDVQYGEDHIISELECDFIFIDRLPEITDIAAVYRNAVMQLPLLMAPEATSGDVYFGAEAYEEWIQDIRNGRYDTYTEESFDAWKHWHIYICNIATNGGHGREFLELALQYNPDMTFISNIIDLLSENERIWNKLESIGGGFNCTLETLKDEKKCEKIALTLEKLQETNHNISEIINSVNRDEIKNTGN